MRRPATLHIRPEPLDALSVGALRRRSTGGVFELAYASGDVTTDGPEQRLLDLLDGIDEPLAITTAIRDRDARILDFRVDFVNGAAAEWAGVAREAMIGRISNELLPELRSSGYFDALRDVVETGRPFHESAAVLRDTVTGGAWVGGMYDVRAIRLGDGYILAWGRRAAMPEQG